MTCASLAHGVVGVTKLQDQIIVPGSLSQAIYCGWLECHDPFIALWYVLIWLHRGVDVNFGNRLHSKRRLW